MATKSLYAATLYNFRGNIKIRIIASAPNESELRQTLADYSPGYTLESILYLCSTPDDVFTEL